MQCKVSRPTPQPAEVRPAHVIQSRPDAGFVFQVKVITVGQVAPSSLGSGHLNSNLEQREVPVHDGVPADPSTALACPQRALQVHLLNRKS